jgi:hypothetical protein
MKGDITNYSTGNQKKLHCQLFFCCQRKNKQAVHETAAIK